MIKNELMNLYGIEENKVFYSTLEGSIAEYDCISKTLNNIVKSPILTQSDFKKGYLEIPINYNGTNGLRYFCIQFGNITIQPNTITTVELHKTYQTFYNVQATCSSNNNVCFNSYFENKNNFIISHNSDIAQSFYWIAFGQTE